MTVGNPPLAGMEEGLVDATWLRGLAGGQNETFQSGIAAAGTTQATATQLPSGIALIEVDTIGASSGVALPFAIAGTEIQIYAAVGVNQLRIYGNVQPNPTTGTVDTINNIAGATGVLATVGPFVVALLCAKNGAWALK